MCGIVGYVTPWANGFTQDELLVFRDMLVIDSVRGFDSTGVFGVSNRGNVEIMKDAITGSAFVNTKDFADFAQLAVRCGQFMVGHNRWATKGSVNPDNAHPFWVDDHIVLVHNGTMRDDHKKHANVEVDSHAIAHLLTKEDNIATALQKINGAYALVWYNTKTKTLHLVRNSERPLYTADVTDGGVIFASEPEFILMAASRNTQKLKKPPELLEPYFLQSYTIGDDVAWTYEGIKVDGAFRYVQPPQQQQHNYNLGRPWGGSRSRSWPMESDDIYGAAIASDYTQPTQNRSPTPLEKTRVDKTFHFYCFNHKFKEFHTSNTSASSFLDSCGTGKQSTHNIQLLDYLPANDHTDCRSFYVYGQSIDAVDGGPKRLYYRLMHDIDEMDVLKMVTTQEFYNVEVTTPQVLVVDRESGNSSVAVAVFTNEVPLHILAGSESQQ